MQSRRLKEDTHPTREDRSFDELYGDQTLSEDDELDGIIPDFVKKLFESIINREDTASPKRLRESEFERIPH